MFINDIFGRKRITESRVDEADYTDNKFKQMMGKVAQAKTPQQHMAELENVLSEIKAARKNLQGVTSQIKYDDTVGEILTQVDRVIQPFRAYIDEMDYKDAVNNVRDAKNQLESAVFGLDELLRWADHRVNSQMVDIQDEIDYPDDDERLKESLRDGEYYVYEVTFDDGTTTKIRTSNDWFDAKTYYAKRGKNVVKSERIGGIQGGDYIPPKKPHQFPDDSFARAQRAYDRQEPKEGVAEGYQDDSKEREENLRYGRSRNPVAADIRKKLNPNSEPGHREIERWATQSEENQKIYNAYIKAGKLADKAYAEKDGAASTGLQLRRKQIRDLIAQKMSGNSENKDVE